jgi:hypothetical protein
MFGWLKRTFSGRQSELNKQKIIVPPTPKESRPQPSKSFHTKVAGVSRRQKALKIIKKGLDNGEYFDVLLQREPSNKHDSNAIMVLVDLSNDGKTMNQIGYIAAHVAASLASQMDRGYKVEAFIEDILGGYEGAQTLGCLIRVDIY